MQCDLIVVGGGPVGACLARSVRDLDVVLVGQEPPPTPRTGAAGFDARVYALSPGNAAVLGLPEERMTPVQAMRVFGDDRSSIEFDAYRAGLPALAWIIEHGVLQEALWRGIECRIVAPARCRSLEVEADHARLFLEDGTQVRGKLIVGADGAASFVRREAGIGVREQPYGQEAVVANFACERDHGQIAYQWFQRGPVLAMLPLPRQHVSMVWSLPAVEATRIHALAPEALCREVERAAQGRLGALSLVTPARRYPLRRLRAGRLAAPRVALLGDAAHVIHPLAGQGLNLGLQDARALAEVLAGREAVRDPGDWRLLRRYERLRAEPVAAMDVMVHGLHRLFGSGDGLAGRLRNAGLNLTDRLSVLKSILIRQAVQ